MEKTVLGWGPTLWSNVLNEGHIRLLVYFFKLSYSWESLRFCDFWGGPTGNVEFVRDPGGCCARYCHDESPHGSVVDWLLKRGCDPHLPGSLEKCGSAKKAGALIGDI
jgi:hypothetical protein